MTPFDCVDGTAAPSFQRDLRLAVFRLPYTDVVVVRATCEQLPCGIPLDLLNVFFVALPGLDRALRLVNVPQVDEFALSSDSDIFAILPFNFEASEIWVDVAVIETSSLPARI